MNFSISITNQAEEDLADIYSFILKEYKSQINADAVLGRLYTEINNLPFMAGEIQNASLATRRLIKVDDPPKIDSRYTIGKLNNGEKHLIWKKI